MAPAGGKDKRRARRRTEEGPDDEVDSDTLSSVMEDVGTAVSPSSTQSSSDDDTEDDNTETKTQLLGRQIFGSDDATEEESTQYTFESRQSNDPLSRLLRDDPLSRLLRGDAGFSKLEINSTQLKDWSKALSLEDVMLEIGHSSVDTIRFDLSKIHASKFEIAFECLAHSKSVEDVEIHKAKFTRKTASIFGAALADNNNSIKRLTFTNCDFEGSGLAVLFLGIQHVPKLMHLAILKSSLAGFASEIVSASLPLLPNLQSLSLIDTSVPTDGLRFLLENVAQARALTELDLSGNVVDEKAMSSLSRCLQSSDTKIKTLILAGCSLDFGHIQQLCRGLKKTQTLETLELSANSIGDSAASSLIQMLGSNKNILTLDVNECGMSDSYLDEIKDALRYNNSFLKNVFSSEVGLAILDSVNLVEQLPTSFG